MFDAAGAIKGDKPWSLLPTGGKAFEEDRLGDDNQLKCKQKESSTKTGEKQGSVGP